MKKKIVDEMIATPLDFSYDLINVNEILDSFPEECNC